MVSDKFSECKFRFDRGSWDGKSVEGAVLMQGGCRRIGEYNPSRYSLIVCVLDTWVFNSAQF